MSTDDPSSLADFHSHLVPGVDDGARTLEEALEGVERLTRASVRKIITTPHLDGSVTREPARFQERMEEMDRGWEEVRGAVAESFPEVDFRRGNEVMLDIPEPDLSDPRIRLGGTDFALVEWPRLQVPPGTPGVVARLAAGDYRPIIAHPARYAGLDRDLELPGAWRDAGAYLQVNYGSLVGRYGVAVQRIAFQLLRKGWVSYLSTDFHGRAHLSLYLDEAREVFLEEGAQEQWRLLSQTNPARLFRNEAPLPVGPLPMERGLWRKLKELFRAEA